MTSALAVTALVFVGVSLVLLVILAIRRVVLDRRARRYAAAVRRVRPIAIVLVEGESREGPVLPPGDQAVLADVLGRYSSAHRRGRGAARRVFPRQRRARAGAERAAFPTRVAASGRRLSVGRHGL
jgi:hypothetical protein